MQLIEQWMKGSKNFVVGRSLYKRFGTNDKLKALLDKGETPHAKQELVKELQAIVNTGVRSTVKQEGRQFEEMPKGTDPVLMALEEEWKPLYMQMNYKRHEMDKYGKSNDLAARTACHALCKDILTLEKEINFIWDRYDHYILNGRLPEVKESSFVLPTEPLKLGTLIKTLERYIRRYKNTAATNPKHAQLLEDYRKKYKQATGKEYGEAH